MNNEQRLVALDIIDYCFRNFNDISLSLVNVKKGIKLTIVPGVENIESDKINDLSSIHHFNIEHSTDRGFIIGVTILKLVFIIK